MDKSLHEKYIAYWKFGIELFTATHRLAEGENFFDFPQDRKRLFFCWNKNGGWYYIVSLCSSELNVNKC